MGAGFLLLPLYTAYLGAADYGIIALSTTLSGVLSVLLLQPFQAMFTRLYFDFSDADERRRFYGSTWLFLLCYVFIGASLLDLIGGATNSLGFAEVPYRPYLRLTVWTTAVSIVAFLLPRALFLVREQAWRLVGLNLSLFLLSTGLIVYFVVFQGTGAYGNLYGSFLATLVMALPALIITLCNISFAWRWEHIKQGLTFALPLVPHLLSLWILSLSDRWILQQYVSLAEIGIYSFGYLIGSIIQIIALSLSEAISPYYLRVASERPDAARVLKRLATYYLAVIVWAAVGLVAMTHEVISLITVRPEYLASTAVIPWVVLGCVARGFYFIFVTAVYHAKNMRMLPVVTMVAGLFNIGLNLLLIPHWGIIAAAINTFVSYTFQAVIMYWLAQSSYPLPYEHRRLITLTVLGLAWGGVLYAFALPDVWSSLIVKTVLAFAFPLGLLVTRFFTPDEVGAARQFVAFLYQPHARH
jgi:O-antigen/teichoic acid export membrane protein